MIQPDRVDMTFKMIGSNKWLLPSPTECFAELDSNAKRRHKTWSGCHGNSVNIFSVWTDPKLAKERDCVRCVLAGCYFWNNPTVLRMNVNLG